MRPGEFMFCNVLHPWEVRKPWKLLMSETICCVTAPGDLHIPEMGEKNLFKKKLSRCQVFFTSFKMFFCWAWCDCESFLKGKLQASYVQTSKLVGCIGYHDQICSIVWFFLFKTPTKLSYPTCLWIWGMVWEMIYTYMICICIFMDHDN